MQRDDLMMPKLRLGEATDCESICMDVPHPASVFPAELHLFLKAASWVNVVASVPVSGHLRRA
jgi:hypothetical protein